LGEPLRATRFARFARVALRRTMVRLAPAPASALWAFGGRVRFHRSRMRGACVV
jgi:hypothetical protein